MKNIHSTMKRYDCAGLSAPQLGVDLRMFVIRFPDVDEFNGTQQEYKNKQMQHIPYTVSTMYLCILLIYTYKSVGLCPLIS